MIDVAERHKTVLIVDDEQDVRVFLSDLLGHEGLLTSTAADGFEALEFVKQHRPDLVITDLRMPGMEGIDLLVRIRQESPETRVMILTAYGYMELYLDALEKGADDMLLKTTKNAELLRIVKRILADIRPGKMNHESSGGA